MNMQALLKQAQKAQQEITKTKKEIDEKVFVGKSSFVTVEFYGNKEIKNIKIDADSIEKEEIEILEDMIVIATKDVCNQIDKETENKMGKYSNMMSGLL